MIFLLIEFLDELVFGVHEAAWPLIRSDLGLSYAQIGLLLSVPGVIAAAIEPVLGILGDMWRRRVLILGGGALFALSMALTALSRSFIPILLATILFFPASGAFVSLSQASLMDAAPERHEHNMARWTFAGSVGVVAGPVLLGAMILIGLGWRQAFWALAVISIVMFIAAWLRVPHAGAAHAGLPSFGAFMDGMRAALAALKESEVRRWLILLEFADLMMDVLLGFLALYFVDVAHMTGAQAAFAVAVWTGVGLLGDFLLIPFVERFNGLDYLRISVWLELILFPAFLLAPQAWLKLVLVGMLGFFNSGWYSVLRARLYATLPGRSASVLVLDNVAGLFGKALPFAIGLVAEGFGLQTAMWLLLAGPLALLVGLPRVNRLELR